MQCSILTLNRILTGCAEVTVTLSTKSVMWGMTINRTGPHRTTPDRTESLTYLLTYLHLAYSPPQPSSISMV